MDEEFSKRLVDYFTSTELVDFLEVPVEELVILLEDYIDDNIEDLEEFMEHGR